MIIGDVKQRTLSPTTKRKKSTKKSKKSKAGAYAVIAANFDPSESFSKPRELKRYDSVAGDSEDEGEKEEDIQPKMNRKQNFDKVLLSEYHFASIHYSHNIYLHLYSIRYSRFLQRKLLR